jgi:hypothetical protein
VANSLQLLLLMGSVVPVPVPQQLSDALQAAQVTTTAGQASGFQLTFAVSTVSVITTSLLPAGFFDPGTRVILIAIVSGLPAVLMDGVITRQDLAPSDEPGAGPGWMTGPRRSR